MNMKIQMFKLDLEKTEEPEIKLPTSAGSSKKQEFQKKNLLFLYWLYQRLWLCGSQQTMENSFFFFLKILKEMEILDRLTCLMRNLYAGQGATKLDME